MARKKAMPLIKDFNNIPEEALVPEREQPYTIPENWKWVRFSSLNTYRSHNVNPGKEPASRFVLYSVPAFPSAEPELATGDEIGSTKQIVAPGDVLVCKINPRINRVWVVSTSPNGELIASSEWIVFRPSLGISDFYRAYFSSPRFRKNLSSHVSGVGGSLTRARPRLVNNYPVPLPPLNEQERIVAYLDENLGKINNVCGKLQDFLAGADERKERLIQAVVSGHLTENWREKHDSLSAEHTSRMLKNSGLQHKGTVRQPPPRIPDFNNIPEEAFIPEMEQPYPIPEQWRWVRLGSAIQLISGRDEPLSTCNSEHRGIPYVMGASNFHEGGLKFERWIEKPNVISKRGSVLITVKGTVGKIAIQKDSQVNLSRQVMALQPDNFLDVRYLELCLRTIVRLLDSKAVGLIPGISRKVLLSIPFPLPPLAEQEEIVQVLDHALNSLAEADSRARESLDKLNLVKQQLVSAALAGRLT